MNRTLIVITSILLLLSNVVSAQDRKIQSDKEISDWVVTYMTYSEKFDGFGGVVIVARNGQPIFQKAYGMANYELNVPNTLDTKFRIGSVSKTFTAAAIMKLNEQKKLNIDDPICNYIENCPASWKEITIRHLLVHTSGLVNYTSLPEAKGTFLLVPHSHEEVLELFRNKPLESEPGMKYNYNNSGYYLLGVIIEKVTGKTCAAYFKEALFDPCKLRNTGFDKNETLLNKRASAYKLTSDNLLENTYTINMENSFAIGGLYSTASDLLLWDQVFYGNELFSPASLEHIFSRNKNTSYGLGWVVDSIGGCTRSYHDGGITDFSASLQRLTDKHITVIAISNKGSDAGIKVAYDIVGKICSYPATIRGFQDDMSRLKSNELFVMIENAKTAFPRFRIKETLVDEIADDLKNQGNMKQTVEVYTLNCLLYANSENVFAKLGEIYLAIGNKKLAKENFEKCLQINPANERALKGMKG
jgi:CubicO group peptidase (beta-lactamase class C family)